MNSSCIENIKVGDRVRIHSTNGGHWIKACDIELYDPYFFITLEYPIVGIRYDTTLIGLQYTLGSNTIARYFYPWSEELEKRYQVKKHNFYCDIGTPFFFHKIIKSR